MMKRIAIACLLFVAVHNGMAQHRPPPVNTYSDEDADEGRGFKKDHIFIGGTINLGFSGYDFNIGGAPEIGYSFNRWFDAGVLINLNYASERPDPNFVYNANTRQRSFNYGAGLFGRFYPLPFLFVVAEPEFNFINYSITPFNGGSAEQTTTYQTQAPSLLLGIGYGRRFIGHSSFYLALMFDALSNSNSPYRDSYTNAALPVIKAGFDIYLHPKRQ
jgi:hypothetical protein